MVFISHLHLEIFLYILPFLTLSWQCSMWGHHKVIFSSLYFCFDPPFAPSLPLLCKTSCSICTTCFSMALNKSQVSGKDKLPNPLHKQHLQQQTHMHTHAILPVLLYIRRWGELKYKDGRCSTSNENCNFCSPGFHGWQEIFHPRCHRRINKTSGAECSPSLSHAYTHTHKDAHALK